MLVCQKTSIVYLRFVYQLALELTTFAAGLVPSLRNQGRCKAGSIFLFRQDIALLETWGRLETGTPQLIFRGETFIDWNCGELQR